MQSCKEFVNPPIKLFTAPNQSKSTLHSATMPINEDNERFITSLTPSMEASMVDQIKQLWTTSFRIYDFPLISPFVITLQEPQQTELDMLLPVNLGYSDNKKFWKMFGDFLNILIFKNCDERKQKHFPLLIHLEK